MSQPPFSCGGVDLRIGGHNLWLELPKDESVPGSHSNKSTTWVGSKKKQLAVGFLVSKKTSRITSSWISHCSNTCGLLSYLCIHMYIFSYSIYFYIQYVCVYTNRPVSHARRSWALGRRGIEVLRFRRGNRLQGSVAEASGSTARFRKKDWSVQWRNGGWVVPNSRAGTPKNKHVVVSSVVLPDRA